MQRALIFGSRQCVICQLSLFACARLPYVNMFETRSIADGIRKIKTATSASLLHVIAYVSHVCNMLIEPHKYIFVDYESFLKTPNF